MPSCLLCRPEAADRELGRIEVWQDRLWRVTVSLVAPVLGFGYLEPKRHIPYITDLSGEEAETLGATLARVTSTLRLATDADLVYVNVFGERHAHLHFNLAPHRPGDGLTGGPGVIHLNAPPIPRATLGAMAKRIRRELAGYDVGPEQMLSARTATGARPAPDRRAGRR